MPHHQSASPLPVSSGGIHHGNAIREGSGRRGWFYGHVWGLSTDPRYSQNVEVKWGRHAAGEARQGWGMCLRATTLSILISGEFEICFSGKTVRLHQPGDYALWGPLVPHSWRALRESTVITVRWPSLQGDSVSSDSLDGFCNHLER